ncbi:MAG: 2-amino-4-hydroxy-6-hydroxymethyldihydropteridine diphosphokinase [Lachnospiraceae bacterium]|nr:2-amino-4-hydroxy-6-hydroxymethyldihydropteridine diphosphokinase [Lachnospiraceae bacterium]
MDKIEIKDLEIFANHGVFEEEKKLGQKFLVSITLFLDVRKAGRNDDLKESIHYGEVSNMVNEWMCKHTFQLLESVAQGLCEELLLVYESSGIKEVEVTVKKPWAPVKLPLDTVAVTVRRKWTEAYLSIGSNIGEKENYLNEAVKGLEEDVYTKVLKISSFITTKPYGEVEQEDFLNGAVQIKTLRNPEELLELSHELEQKAKRERKVHWGPRTLDVDIIFYGKEIVEEEDLMIPHIDMQNREFVLKPLMELCPYFVHPLLEKRICTLYGELKIRLNGSL